VNPEWWSQRNGRELHTESPGFLQNVFLSSWQEYWPVCTCGQSMQTWRKKSWRIREKSPSSSLCVMVACSWEEPNGSLCIYLAWVWMPRKVVHVGFLWPGSWESIIGDKNRDCDYALRMHWSVLLVTNVMYPQPKMVSYRTLNCSQTVRMP
jgi:hypothetical protein